MDDKPERPGNASLEIGEMRSHRDSEGPEQPRGMWVYRCNDM